MHSPRLLSHTDNLTRCGLLYVNQVSELDDESTQLKALQAGLTLLQSRRAEDSQVRMDGGVVTNGPATDAAPVQAGTPVVVALCLRLLSGALTSPAVHATCAATLRQGLSVVLDRAAGGGRRAHHQVHTCAHAPSHTHASPTHSPVAGLAILHALLAAFTGEVEVSSSRSPALVRAFALDVLDAACTSHRLLFASTHPFPDLLTERLVPILVDELCALAGESTVDGRAANQRVSTTASPLHRAAPTSPLMPQPEEIGVDPADVALCRVLCRTAGSVARVCAPREECARLLNALCNVAMAPSTPAWCVAAAMDALRQCVADTALVARLATRHDGASANDEQHVMAVARIGEAAQRLLLNACGPMAAPLVGQAALAALAHQSQGRSADAPLVPAAPPTLAVEDTEGENEAAQLAYAACVAFACVSALCSTADTLAKSSPTDGAATRSVEVVPCARAVVDACWEPLSGSMQLLFTVAYGNALASDLLAAHHHLMRAAATTRADGCRDAMLHMLCTHAAAGIDPSGVATHGMTAVAAGGEASAAASDVDPAPASTAAGDTTPPPKGAMSRSVSRVTRASMASNGPPVVLHCALSLLAALQWLSPMLGPSSWQMVMDAMARVDAAYQSGVAATVGNPAELGAALDAAFKRFALAQATEHENAVAALRRVSAREVRAIAGVVDATAAAGGDISRSGHQRVLHLLPRHGDMVIAAAAQRLADVWPGFEAHVAEVVSLASGSAPRARTQAALLLGSVMQRLLTMPVSVVEAPSCKAAAARAGQPTFSCFLLASFARVAPPGAGCPIDARVAALHALRDIMQGMGETLGPAWRPVVEYVGASAEEMAAPGTDAGTAQQLVNPTFKAASALAQHALRTVPAALSGAVVAALHACGRQAADVNAALAAVSLVWDVTDEGARQASMDGVLRPGAPSSDDVIPAALDCLAQLGRDPRPEVRNSALRALINAIASHGTRLAPKLARDAVWRTLVPTVAHALDQSSQATSTGPLAQPLAGTVQLLVHHSRDSAAKQWDETLVLGLNGVVRCLRSLLPLLSSGSGFEQLMEDAVGLLDAASRGASREVSLAAVACTTALASSTVPGPGSAFDASSSERAQAQHLAQPPTAAAGLVWKRCIAVLESAASSAVCGPARAEAPLCLARLYTSHRDAFDADDVSAVLRAADAAARGAAPEGVSAHTQQSAGELSPQHRAGLDIARALVPFPPRIAAAGGHQALLKWLAMLVADSATTDAESNRPTPVVGAHAGELLGTLFPAAPASVRAQCCADVTLNLGQGVAASLRSSPGDLHWRAAADAWVTVARAGASAVVECTSQGSTATLPSAACAAAWRALESTASDMLLVGEDVPPLGMLCASPEQADSVTVDAQRLAADEALVLEVVSAIGYAAMTGALAPPKAGPGAALASAALIQALRSGARHSVDGRRSSGEQWPVMHCISVACVRQLCALTSPRASLTAGLALAAVLDHCRELLGAVASAESDSDTGAGQHLHDATLVALEALSEVRSSVHTVDAAVAAAQEAQATARDGADGLAHLLPLLRTTKPASRQEHVHVLLIYGPLVGAIHARDVRIRKAVSGACAGTPQSSDTHRAWLTACPHLPHAGLLAQAGRAMGLMT